MKRIIAYLTALVLMLGCTACGNQEPAFDPNSNFHWAKRVLSPADPQLDWDQVPDQKKVYVRGLMEIREAYPQIKEVNEQGINPNWRMLSKLEENTKGYTLCWEDAEGNEQRLLVLANLRDEKYRFTIPTGYYDVLAFENKAVNGSLGNVSGVYLSMPPRTLAILVSK